MKVNSNLNGDISFDGFYNNKLLKKGLEFAADNGSLFAATTTLVLSTGIRPAVIMSTPKVNKEDKKVACTKSIISSLIGYGIMLLASRPIARAIKNIDKNPSQYLKKETVKNLQGHTKTLTEAKAYEFATQMFKLGIGAVVACPKALLTSLGLSYAMQSSIYKQDKTQNNSLSFKGNSPLSKGIGKLLDNKSFQEFSKKYKDSNFPMHIIAGTDTLTTATFIHQTFNDKNIKDERKMPLIYNSAISTALSIISGYAIDKLLDNPTQNFINKFKLANKNDGKLNKYIEGIQIAKPILIVGGIYYILIPFISTLMAEYSNKVHKSKLLSKS